MIDCKTTRKKTQACDAQAQILAAVDELFYLEGARAVGVDAVVKRAGVNKMSLYRQFASKDALLMEYLQRREEKYWANFEASLAQYPGEPKKQLLQIVLDVAQRTSCTGYRGCPFVNIAVEFPDPQHPARRLVANNKARLLSRLGQLANDAHAKQAELLVSALALLLEGAYAASQTYGNSDLLLARLPEIGTQLIDEFC